MSIVSIDFLLPKCYHSLMPTLKALREKATLSQRELAELTGLTTSTINRIETGKQKPIPRTVRKLAKALGVEPSEIDFSK